MKKSTKKITALTTIMLLAIVGFGQVAGDFRTAAAGPANWDVPATWQIYDGAAWNVATAMPGATNSVYVQAGHTVVVNIAVAACNDLHINNGSSALVNIGANTLEVSGKLRAYTGVAGTIPGTSTSTIPSPGFISTTTGGKLKMVGSTRNITNTGEWGANPINWNFEVALTAGQEGTISTGFKAGNIDIVSGTLISNSGLRPDGGTFTFPATATGFLTVRSGATLRMGNAQALQRINTAGASSHFNTFTLEAGGTLEYRQASGPIGASTINLSGTVVYNSSTAQTLVTKGGNTNGADPNVYTNLTIQDVATRTLGLNTTVNGTLSMRTVVGGSPVLALGGFTLTYGSSATLQYRGIGSPPPSQTTTNAEWPDAVSGLSMPPTVDVFNASNVVLNSNKTTNELKLSGGTSINAKAVLGANNLSVSSINIPTPDGNKYVVTDGAGVLQIRSVGTTAKLFPVGPSTSLYHPATITNAGTVDDYSVKVASVVAPCGTAPDAVNATWDISEAVMGGSDCTFSLDYTGSATGGSYNPATAKIFHCNGSAVDCVNGSVTGTVATGSGFTAFSPFFISSDPVILPVTLTQFTGTKNGNSINLNWSVANEVNVKNYIVQRSTNGIDFKNIATVNAARKNNYSATDFLPIEGNNYYRLQVVDFDGSSKYSNIVRLEMQDIKANIKVYPTVTTGVLYVVSNNNSYKNYSLFGVNGKQILNGNMTDAKELNLSALQAGTYVLKIGNQHFTIIKN